MALIECANGFVLVIDQMLRRLSDPEMLMIPDRFHFGDQFIVTSEQLNSLDSCPPVDFFLLVNGNRPTAECLPQMVQSRCAKDENGSGGTGGQEIEEDLRGATVTPNLLSLECVAFR